jgi:TatA/E family protein of Tat protein translocase
MGLPNIGPLELIIILAIALLIVGPGRLPEMGNAIGRTIKEFRKASTDITDATSREPDKMEPDKTAGTEPAAAVPAAAPDAPAATDAANTAAAPAEASQPEANALSGAAIPNTTTLTPPATAPSEPKADGKDDA